MGVGPKTPSNASPTPMLRIQRKPNGRCFDCEIPRGRGRGPERVQGSVITEGRSEGREGDRSRRPSAHRLCSAEIQSLLRSHANGSLLRSERSECRHVTMSPCNMSHVIPCHLVTCHTLLYVGRGLASNEITTNGSKGVKTLTKLQKLAT